jgi:hypothetical protein
MFEYLPGACQPLFDFVFGQGENVFSVSPVAGLMEVMDMLNVIDAPIGLSVKNPKHQTPSSRETSITNNEQLRGGAFLELGT